MSSFLSRLAADECILQAVLPNPDNAWITQQARQVMWEIDEREPAIHFLIRDNDKKFSHAFDMVFRSAGIHVIPIPHHAPNANAFAERGRREAVWITVQEVQKRTFNEPAVPSAVL
jgi:hypothetical protein